MSEADGLLNAFENQLQLPWGKNLAGPQKVWFAVYTPSQERRIRLRVDDFAAITQNAGYKWKLVDLTNVFAHWMSNHEYREAYFKQPELVEIALQDFTEYVVESMREALVDPIVDENTIVAVLGAGSLFGLTKVSTIADKVTKYIKGRLLVFFPGNHEGSNYRLLDARDGWDYMAIPIKAEKGS